MKQGHSIHYCTNKKISTLSHFEQQFQSYTRNKVNFQINFAANAGLVSTTAEVFL